MERSGGPIGPPLLKGKPSQYCWTWELSPWHRTRVVSQGVFQHSQCGRPRWSASDSGAKDEGSRLARQRETSIRLHSLHSKPNRFSFGCNTSSKRQLQVFRQSQRRKRETLWWLLHIDISRRVNASQAFSYLTMTLPFSFSSQLSSLDPWAVAKYVTAKDSKRHKEIWQRAGHRANMMTLLGIENKANPSNFKFSEMYQQGPVISSKRKHGTCHNH